nr:S1 RNA-binding domain-containing protein [Chloroflexota bacterium]
MTEEKQGTAPDTEANASVTPQVSDQPVGAVAIADEPAETSQAPEIEDSADATASPETVEEVDAGEEADSGDPGESGDSTQATPDSGASPEATPDGSDEAEPEADTAASAVGAVVETAADVVGSDDDQDAAADSAAPAADSALPAADASDAPTSEASSGLDEADTADAPSADDEPEPVAPPRDLGPEPTTMEELLAEQDSDIKSFKHGDVVEGNVVRIDKDEILVDIGAKSEGVVSNRELFGRHGGEGQAPLNIGDTVLVYVLQPESPEGHAVLSLRRAGLERKWRAMQEQFETGVIIEAPVIDHNKGGLIVDCGIRGFVPISQIVDFPRRPQNEQPRDAAQEIAEKLQPYVGRKLRLKILEVN